MKKKNFIVTNDKRYLYITFLGNSKNTGEIYYTDYSPELEKILNSGIFNSANTNGSTKGNYLKFYYNRSNNIVYFHHIIFCYLYRNLTIENYMHVLAEFRRELSGGYEIDHLYEDVHNNCKANLSLIQANTHKKKVRIKRKLKFFCDLIEAYDGSNYRVQFSYVSSYNRQRVKALRYYTNSFDEVLNIRKYIKQTVKGLRGYNQWHIKNSGKGILLQDNTYSVFGDMRLRGKLPKLITELDVADLQNNIVDLPLKDFEKWEMIF